MGSVGIVVVLYIVSALEIFIFPCLDRIIVVSPYLGIHRTLCTISADRQVIAGLMVVADIGSQLDTLVDRSLESQRN